MPAVRSPRAAAAVVLAGVLALAVGCSGSAGQAGPAAPTAGVEEGASAGTMFPDVVDARATQTGPDTVSVSATISSPYDSPQRYADAFRISTPSGEVLGVRELLHDHAGEQPFTRSVDGVRVPPGTDTLVVQGRDMVSGWGGASVTVAAPG